MTPRQRVLRALNHESVDRVPVDFGGTRQSGIAALAYQRLREELGIDSSRPFRIFHLYQQLAEIEAEVHERLPSDMVLLNRPAVCFGIENRDWKPFRFFDGPEVMVPGGFNPETEPNGNLVLRKGDFVSARMPRNGFYFDRYDPYPGASHPDLDTWEPSRLGSPELDHYETESRRLCEETDRAVVVALGPPYELFNGIGQGGFEDWMITFATEDEYVERLYTKLTDAWIENLEALHSRVGDRVQVLQIADDLGTQSSQFLSTDMFREKVMPFYKRGLDWIHENTDWKVLLHSDGAIFGLIPSLIEMGVDALNPIQTSATGMEPDRLVEAFGGKIAFWGGSCDSQGTLATGTPDEVDAEVRKNLQSFRPLEGGFVFASVHNIQANVPAALRSPINRSSSSRRSA